MIINWYGAASVQTRPDVLRTLYHNIKNALLHTINQYLQHQKHVLKRIKHIHMRRVKFPLEHYIKHIQGLDIFLHLTGGQHPPDGLEVRIFLAFPLMIQGAKLRYLYLVQVHHGKKENFY